MKTRLLIHVIRSYSQAKPAAKAIITAVNPSAFILPCTSPTPPVKGEGVGEVTMIVFELLVLFCKASASVVLSVGQVVSENPPLGAQSGVRN